MSGHGPVRRRHAPPLELYLTVGGQRPVPLSAAMESGYHAVINSTNPTLPSRPVNAARERTDRPEQETQPLAQETVNIRRTIVVGEQLHYEIALAELRPPARRTSVELSLTADFADVFEVRQIERRTAGTELAPVVNGSRVSFAYVAQDGVRRTTCVQLSPPGTDRGGRPARACGLGGRARSPGSRSRCRSSSTRGASPEPEPTLPR